MSISEITKNPSDFRPQTPLQTIASQIERLIYKDMIEWARDLHSASDAVGKTPTDIADLLHDWAERTLNHHQEPHE